MHMHMCMHMHMHMHMCMHMLFPPPSCLPSHLSSIKAAQSRRSHTPRDIARSSPHMGIAH